MNEDGIKIGERFFPFVRITESSQPKVVKKITRTNWRAVLYNLWKQKKRNKYITDNPKATYKDLIVEGLVYTSVYQQKREYKIIRSVAFQKPFPWKWFGIVPYELRCKIIKTRDARSIKKKFDNYCLEQMKDADEQIDSSSNSQTKNSEVK